MEAGGTWLNLPVLLQVTGSKNEEQVLNAIEAYMEFRPELAHRAINQLFDIARIQHCSQLLRALQVCVCACVRVCVRAPGLRSSSSLSSSSPP